VSRTSDFGVPGVHIEATEGRVVGFVRTGLAGKVEF